MTRFRMPTNTSIRTRFTSRVTTTAAITLTLGLALSSCSSTEDAVTSVHGTKLDIDPISNCDFDLQLDSVPERAITMNQAATEIMLALDLADSMVGTAYLDDEIHPDFAEDYASIPVLSDVYPAKEVIWDNEPDFLYSSYSSGFTDDNAGSREDLADIDINTYLSPSACDSRDKTTPMTFDDVFDEIRTIGTIFNVADEAEALISEQRALIADAQSSVADKDLSVLWWDSKTDTPFIGACCGAPNMIMQTLGLTNIFNDVDGNWGDVGWEQIVEAEPDVIIVIDADWDTADSKITHLETDPIASSLNAAKNGHISTIPFSATTTGVRNAEAVVQLSNDLAELPKDD